MFLENLKNLLSSRDIFFHALALKFFSSWAGEGKFDQKVSKDSWNANSVDEAELNLKLLLTPSCISDKDPIFQCPFLRRKITFKRRICHIIPKTRLQLLDSLSQKKYLLETPSKFFLVKWDFGVIFIWNSCPFYPFKVLKVFYA